MACCTDFNTYHRHSQNCPERLGGEPNPQYNSARLRLPVVITGPTGNTVRVEGEYEETIGDRRGRTIHIEKKVR